MTPAPPSVKVIVPRRGINDGNRGKKHALLHLAEAADTDYIWMMDDDVVPPAVSESDMGALLLQLGSPDMLILPLKMNSGHGTLTERLQQTEYAAIQQLTIDSARRGKAVMCSGANLVVRRKCWLESYKDLHPELPSGDDMFLLQSFKRRGLRIAVADSEELTAEVTPCPDLRSLFRQRTRWAGKSGHYTDRDILLCGAIVAGANIMQLLCPPFILIKFPCEYALIKKRDATASLLSALLLELLYPLYMLLCLAGGLLQSRQSGTRF